MSATQSRSVLRHVTGLFADRKIGVKIAIGFFCVLAITAAISAMANLAFGIVATSFETVGKRVEMVGIVRDVDREFLAMQRYVREYAMLGRERDMETAQARRKSVNDAIKDALRAIADPERTAKIKELAEQFDVYGKTFDALIPLRREEAKLTSEVLDPAGVRLRADIQKLQQWTVEKSDNINAVILAGEAMKQLMIARLNVTRLLGQREQAAAEAAEKASGDLESVLTEMEGVADTAEARSLLAEIKTLAQKYHQTYRRAAEISERIDALVNGDMVKIGDAVATDAQAIKQSGIADQQAIEQSTIDLIRNREQFILWLAVGGLVVGVLLAWLIGRAISKPLVGLVRGVQKLADGHFDVVLPGLGRATRSATWPARSRRSRSSWRPRRNRRPRRKPRRGKRPRPSARRRCTSSPTSSRRRSATSSRPCRRPRPSWKRPPTR